MQPHVDARLCEGFGRAGDQLGLVFDYITDVIGSGSGREGDVLARLQYRHLQVRIETLRLGRSARSSSTSTDDYQFLGHDESSSDGCGTFTGPGSPGSRRALRSGSPTRRELTPGAHLIEGEFHLYGSTKSRTPASTCRVVTERISLSISSPESAEFPDILNEYRCPYLVISEIDEH